MLAQLVERLTCKERVGGSIPSHGSRTENLDVVKLAAFPLLVQAVYNAGELLKHDVRVTSWRCNEGAYTGGMLDCVKLLTMLERYGIHPRDKVKVLADKSVVFHHIFDDSIERIMRKFGGEFVAEGDGRNVQEELEVAQKEIERLKNEIRQLNKQKGELKANLLALRRMEKVSSKITEFLTEIRGLRDNLESCVSAIKDPVIVQRLRQEMSRLYRIEQKGLGES